ncbi:MAG: hypothetical protein IPP72_01850 [Chitinophagaceae bacterium]|nr:hypothetical protein [Chitinophagaceae bacterium]
MPLCLVLLLFACLQPAPLHAATAAETKQHLLSLERKWIEVEFALDTAYVATLVDSTFFSVAADPVSNMLQEINGIYANMNAMHKDGIFLDSLKLEDAVVNVYENTAVTRFVSHIYKKGKGRSTEKRMRFYDICINGNGQWKAASSKGLLLN